MTANVYTVSTSAQLMGALSKASGGDTILLQEGNYGTLTLNQYSSFNVQFASNVTIASADPDHPGIITKLGLTNVSNLTFDGIKFDYTFKEGDKGYTSDFIVAGSSNVTIRNSTFDGDVAEGISVVDDGFGNGIGLSIRNSSGILIENNDIYNFGGAIRTSSSTNVTVRGNEIHDIRVDGMQFSAVQDVLIENNYIHDFRASYASGDHRDMIQFWTSGTSVPSSNITIRGNTLDMGEGSYTQGIFMRNELVDMGKAGLSMYYKNVLIEDNTIYNGHSHGITVGETQGLVIRDNSVLRAVDPNNPDQSSSALWIPQINTAAKSQNVTIENNITAGIDGFSGQTGWVVRSNALVQDINPHGAGYYGDVFITSSIDLENGGHDFVIRPGGLADTLHAGSSQNAFTLVTSKVEPAFVTSAPVDNAAARIFDASYSTGPTGSLPAGTIYQWDFGDGTTATGKIVQHSFPDGGKYPVTLTVILPSGARSQETGLVPIEGPHVLSFGADGVFRSYSYGDEQTLSPAASLLSLDSGDKSLNLGGSGTALTVKGAMLSGLIGADNFNIDVDLKADVKGSTGEIFRSTNAFFATINSKGELQFVLSTTTTPNTTIVAKGVALNDGNTHSVNISFANGLLNLTVDGKELASIPVSGTLSTNAMRDLIFGNSWGQTNFDGHIKAFEITTDAADFSEAASLALTDPAPLPAIEVAPAPLEPVDIVAKTDPLAEAVVEAPTVVTKQRWSGDTLDLHELAVKHSLWAKGGAEIITTGDVTRVHLGVDDHVSLGRQTQFEASSRIAFEVDFQRATTDDISERLVWNHMKIGLAVREDGLMATVGTADGGTKSFKVANLGLNDTEAHSAMVMLDAKTDRLQVMLDDKVVIDVKDVDFDIVGHGGHEWGWTLGSAWNEDFQGQITDFRLGDRFDFLDDYVPAPHALLS